MSDENIQDPNAGNENNGGAPQTPWYENAGIPAEEVTESVKKYGSLDAFVKGYNNLNKIAGGIPQETASDDVKNAFYAKLGRPESPDKYTWKAPEGVGVDDKAFGDFRAEAHKLGITDRQFSGILNKWGDSIKALTAARDAQLQQIAEDSRKELSAPNEWGDKYQEKYDATLKRIEELGVKDELAQAGLLNNPKILKFVHAVVSAGKESDIKDGTSKADIQDRIARLKANKAYMDASDVNHADVIRQLNELYEMQSR